jgi:radical SAM superfamily enzyme YgiQ (UPF0313 family)
MKVLMVSANSEKRFGPIPPLGALCVAAAIRKAGHTVCLVDLCFAADMRIPLQKALSDYDPEVIGISLRNIDNTLYLAPVFYLPQVKAVVAECRKHSSAAIIPGGPGFSSMPEAVLRYCDVPLGVTGEGEMAFCQLLHALEEKRAVDTIPGTAMLRGGQYFQNPPQPIPSPELNGLPAPAWDLLDPGYFSHHDPPVVGNIESKRGCAFHCTYCSYPMVQGRALRLRSPGRVAREALSLQEDFGFKYVEFTDNVFNYPPEHALKICRELILAHNQLPWGCSLHPGYIDGELLTLMAEAGCCRIELGADSASRKMLKNLGKDFEPETLNHSLELCKASGIDFACYIILGGPGENIRTINETLTNLEKLDPPAVYFMPGIRIYPGTGIETIAREEGIITGEEDLLAPRFYLSGGMKGDAFNRTVEYIQSHPNWIVLGMRGQAETA